MSARQQRYALARLAERIIDRLDELEDDPDLENNGDDEEGGDGDPFVRTSADYYPGGPADAEDNGDGEHDADDEDSGGEDLTRAGLGGYGADEDREPSHNAPASGFGLLGTAAWVPGPVSLTTL